jgi:hypothetical protein
VRPKHLCGILNRILTTQGNTNFANATIALEDRIIDQSTAFGYHQAKVWGVEEMYVEEMLKPS